MSGLEGTLDKWSTECGVEMPSEKMLSAFAVNVEQMYLQTTAEHLDARFPQTALLQAFDIFSETTIFAEQHDASYGRAGLEALTKHFNPTVVDADKLQSELPSFHSAVAQMESHQHLREKEPHAVMEALAKSKGLRELYPNLAKLVSLGLVLPTSFVDCERGFSAINQIKTRFRSRMSTQTLQNLLFISIEGPDLQIFDFGRACDSWAAMKKRRISVTK